MSAPESVAAYPDLQDLERDRVARTRLVDMGWTPPKHAVHQPQVPTKAWMHPTSTLASTDPHAYTGLSAGPARALVLKEDVVDHIDWLEHGIDEWRTAAMEAFQKNRELSTLAKLLQAEIDSIQSRTAEADVSREDENEVPAP